MKLTRNKIFLGILTFGLITNLLVFFDIQYFYFRAIFSFIFLTTIPGLLIMLMLKIRKIGFWEYLVYTVGLSIAFLMFGGLLVNWTLPLVGISQPLSLYPLSISFNFLMLIFSFVAYLRNKDISYEFKFIKQSLLNWIFSITPMIFPLLSILGAITLNNGGSNTLAMASYTLICILILLVFFNRHRVDNRIYPFMILMISISFLLSGWLRSQYVSGSDLNHEFQVFQIAKDNRIWKISDYYNAYNSCLSLNILPTVLSVFLNINDQYIFKLFIPIIFSITPVIVYLISKKYLVVPLSLLATFFFMSQPVFTSWASIPIRQEIAFVSFSLSILILLSKNIDTTVRKMLFLGFNIAMIVSHYSTAYIALTIYFLMYCFHKVNVLFNFKRKISYYHPAPLSGKILILLLIFTYIWYSRITFGFSNVVEFVNNGVKNVNSILTSSVQAQGQSIFDQINIFHKESIGPEILTKYIYEISDLYKQSNSEEVLYGSSIASKYETKIFVPQGIPNKLNDNFLYYSVVIRNAFKLFGVFLIILGILYYAFTKSTRRKGALFLNLASLVIILLATITPYLSIDYDLERTYQQVLIVLSFSAVLGLMAILNIFKTNRLLNLISLFFLFYLLLLSRFTQQFIGGSDISMVFNNVGTEYSMLYTHKTDIFSGQWLLNNCLSSDLIFADHYANRKLRLTDISKYEDRIKMDVLPATIPKDSYVYLSYANVIDKVAFKPYKGNMLTYNYPNLFLADNKNLIYSNGGSEIYK